MDLVQLIFLALLQGLTEFLPISSSAHLILPAQLGWWSDQGLAFDIGVHVGSLLAVLVYFRAQIRAFIVSLLTLLRGGAADQHARLLGLLVVATLPIVVVGFLARDWASQEARSLWVIAIATGGFGLLLGYADRRARGSAGRSEMALGWRDAVIIGCFQVLSVIPGTSRSGITMTAGLLLNLSREATARFSFLLSIPTILGAALLATLDALSNPEPVTWPEVLLGLTVSGLAAYMCIHFFVQLIERIGMMPFVVYRLVLSVCLLSLVFG